MNYRNLLKGGVGKTSMACAAAVQLADRATWILWPLAPPTGADGPGSLTPRGAAAPGGTKPVWESSSVDQQSVRCV